MNKLSCLAIIIITSLNYDFVLGQEHNQKNTGRVSNIIYAPTQHLNMLKPGLRFGYEIPRTDDISVVAWAGFYHSNLYFFKNSLHESFFNYRNLAGFQLAVEPKKYLIPKYRTIGPSTYISIRLGLDKVVEYRRERVLRQNGAYSQSIDFKRKEVSFPLIVHLGRKLFNIYSLHVDGSIGLGSRYFVVNNDLPEDAEFQDLGFFRNSGDFIDGNFFRFAFQIGIYISVPTSKQNADISHQM
ncbi:MAG: hypothetical protein ACI8XB_001904 [Patiriisocius sp.]|jgi:hypothetical protein